MQDWAEDLDVGVWISLGAIPFGLVLGVDLGGVGTFGVRLVQMKAL